MISIAYLLFLIITLPIGIFLLVKIIGEKKIQQYASSFADKVKSGDYNSLKNSLNEIEKIITNPEKRKQLLLEQYPPLIAQILSDDKIDDQEEEIVKLYYTKIQHEKLMKQMPFL
jgi:hypothetical protein